MVQFFFKFWRKIKIYRWKISKIQLIFIKNSLKSSKKMKRGGYIFKWDLFFRERFYCLKSSRIIISYGWKKSVQIKNPIFFKSKKVLFFNILLVLEFWFSARTLISSQNKKNFDLIKKPHWSSQKNSGSLWKFFFFMQNFLRQIKAITQHSAFINLKSHFLRLWDDLSQQTIFRSIH